MTTPPFPDATALDLDHRPVCGHDLLFLQQWYNLTAVETCYLLGLGSLQQWHAYTRDASQPVSDPSLALLVWTLLTFPEAHYLPDFPPPADVFPLYQAMAAQSTQTLAEKRRGRLSKTAFGVLLGRETTSTGRWLSDTNPRPASASVRRLLWVFRNVLLTHGVRGLDLWMQRLRREAAERGLSLAKMTSWFRMPGYAKPRQRPPPPAQPPRPRGRPKRRLPAPAAEESDS